MIPGMFTLPTLDFIKKPVSAKGPKRLNLRLFSRDWHI
jgi:hypothetical protein